MKLHNKILLILLGIVVFLILLFIPIFKSKAVNFEDLNSQWISELNNPRSLWELTATKINNIFGTSIPETGGELFGTILGNFLPESNGFPFNAQKAIFTILVYAQQLSFVIPFKTIFIALGIVLSWDFLFMVVRLIKWVISTVRG